jgi:hypothetical protein
MRYHELRGHALPPAGGCCVGERRERRPQGETSLQGGIIMAKGNNAQKKETKKPKKDSAKNGKKK